MRPSLLLIGLVIGASVAQAQDRPPMTPTRDVTITYKVLGQQAAQMNGRSVQISHGAGNGLMRIDTPEMGGYAIIDRTRKRSTMVMTPMQMYMEVDASQAPMGATAMPEENARFTRKGTETIAGQTCTLWDVTTPKGDGSACITTDGAMLRYRTKAGDGVEATSVSYAAIPAANFTVPAGFRKMDMPAMGGPPPGMGTPRPR